MIIEPKILSKSTSEVNAFGTSEYTLHEQELLKFMKIMFMMMTSKGSAKYQVLWEALRIERTDKLPVEEWHGQVQYWIS